MKIENSEVGIAIEGFDLLASPQSHSGFRGNKTGRLQISRSYRKGGGCYVSDSYAATLDGMPLSSREAKKLYEKYFFLIDA